MQNITPLSVRPNIKQPPPLNLPTVVRPRIVPTPISPRQLVAKQTPQLYPGEGMLLPISLDLVPKEVVETSQGPRIKVVLPIISLSPVPATVPQVPSRYPALVRG